MSESSTEEMAISSEEQSDEEEASSDAMEDVGEDAGEDFDMDDPEEVVDHLVEWIDDNFDKEANYTVAVVTIQANDNSELMISKVGGLGTQGKVAQEIIAHIKEVGINEHYTIYFAKKFTGDGPTSNHAEMCILAAAGENNISYLRCIAPNCAFCEATLEDYGVNNGTNAEGEAKTQVGWRHPFFKIHFGSAVNNDIDNQVTELRGINQSRRVPKRLRYGGMGHSAPKGGWIEIDFSDGSDMSDTDG